MSYSDKIKQKLKSGQSDKVDDKRVYGEKADGKQAKALIDDTDALKSLADGMRNFTTSSTFEFSEALKKLASSLAIPKTSLYGQWSTEPTDEPIFPPIQYQQEPFMKCETCKHLFKTETIGLRTVYKCMATGCYPLTVKGNPSRDYFECKGKKWEEGHRMLFTSYQKPKK